MESLLNHERSRTTPSKSHIGNLKLSSGHIKSKNSVLSFQLVINIEIINELFFSSYKSSKSGLHYSTS